MRIWSKSSICCTVVEKDANAGALCSFGLCERPAAQRSARHRFGGLAQAAFRYMAPDFFATETTYGFDPFALPFDRQGTSGCFFDSCG